MNKNELKTILEQHVEFLLDETKGKRADLSGADLSEANLREANLRGADLREANLSGADLRGAKGIISIGPIGSRGDILYAVIYPNSLMIKTGCFWGTADEFESAVEKTHGNNLHARAYRAALALARLTLTEPDGETTAGPTDPPGDCGAMGWRAGEITMDRRLQ